MLKKDIITKVKSRKNLIAEIATIRSVDYQTVERWLDQNHPNLMHLFVLEAIGRHLFEPITNLYE